MTHALRLVLDDQLSLHIAALRDLAPANDVVLMAEVADETTYVRHHKKKLAFVFAAMRALAQRLERNGIRVHDITLDAPGNSGSLTGELKRGVAALQPTEIVATELANTASLSGDGKLGRTARSACRDPAGHPLYLLPRRVPGLGERPPTTADGVLLPPHA